MISKCNIVISYWGNVSCCNMSPAPLQSHNAGSLPHTMSACDLSSNNVTILMHGISSHDVCLQGLPKWCHNCMAWCLPQQCLLAMCPSDIAILQHNVSHCKVAISKCKALSKLCHWCLPFVTSANNSKVSRQRHDASWRKATPPIKSPPSQQKKGCYVTLYGFFHITLMYTRFCIYHHVYCTFWYINFSTFLYQSYTKSCFYHIVYHTESFLLTNMDHIPITLMYTSFIPYLENVDGHFDQKNISLVGNIFHIPMMWSLIFFLIYGNYGNVLVSICTIYYTWILYTVTL